MAGPRDFRLHIARLAARAARAAIASYTSMNRDEKAEVLVRNAIKRLPSTGKLRSTEKAIVVALTHLVSEVPRSVPDYSFLVETVRSLHARARG